MTHAEYVKTMSNPYNYFEFTNYCASNGMAVLNFATFAALVQTEILDKNTVPVKAPEPVPITPRPLPTVNTEAVRTCCGGGKVL